ncbi:hypothetical protein CAOG_06680 [Capsaspora owczarzaki ATCC 30864]|uniref:Uncharacterized protein n=1 Tax=Capsaspora owczarzaki (strain ATCC 30864) TaxID=595528 RepID=A0A0D2WUH4_CAPO3|nr:hypothetical protein CAOG_06680 [Capsaspora owczarzaki ATCC 30864]KJE96340.1 hypothetical protein CAOG_006680 [Capsaspora owczarzaki ATCC 30864]|eukprot:XP_004344301.1 hypothetical protein CAOG_06680 [Capsaspora owczarzaki ATCC 30864]
MAGNAQHDAILDAIFDPTLTLSTMRAPATIRPIARPTQPPALSESEREAVALELQAVRLASSVSAVTSPSPTTTTTSHPAADAAATNDGDSDVQRLAEAEVLLRKAIALAPRKPSLYNNLAQVLRLRHHPTASTTASCGESATPGSCTTAAPATTSAFSEILTLLGRAIELSDPTGAKSPAEFESDEHLRTARQAYVQRALVRQLLQLDADSKADHRRAAELGSDFSRTELVNSNPYAAMCNAMMGQYLATLKGGAER